MGSDQDGARNIRARYDRPGVIPHPTYRIFSDTPCISFDSPACLPVYLFRRSLCSRQLLLRGISRLRSFTTSSFDLAASGIVIALRLP